MRCTSWRPSSNVSDHSLALALRACAAFPGLRNAGLDIMVADMARPGGHAVVEIDSSRGIASFLEVWEGEPVDVAGAMADRLLAAAKKEEAGG